MWERHHDDVCHPPLSLRTYPGVVYFLAPTRALCFIAGVEVIPVPTRDLYPVYTITLRLFSKKKTKLRPHPIMQMSPHHHPCRRTSPSWPLVLAALATISSPSICLGLANPRAPVTSRGGKSGVEKTEKGEKTYNYFGFGSNMASATMTDLRNLSPLASTAAVLPAHRLAFNVPGTPFVEPSWASVEPSGPDFPLGGGDGGENAKEWCGDVCHGVLYKLSESDFDSVCRTEGVPFGYSLHRCRVIPYTGNGESAGEGRMNETLQKIAGGDTEPVSKWGVSAFTLRAARKEWRRADDIPPSRSYMNVLLRGAREYKLDDEYVRKLQSTPVGKTLIGDGIAESMLTNAEARKRQ